MSCRHGMILIIPVFDSQNIIFVFLPSRENEIDVVMREYPGGVLINAKSLERSDFVLVIRLWCAVVAAIKSRSIPNQLQSVAMKTVLFRQHGGPEVLEYTDFPTPEPKPGEALIRLHAAALNRMDVMVRNGWPGLKLELPHINGADGAGVIVALIALFPHQGEGD